MTKEWVAVLGLAIGLFPLAGALPVDALAQARNAESRSAAADAGAGKAPRTGAPAAAGAGTADMRLWSFGECARNFPWVDSPEHKECVRVVGSDEAKDARAFHFCEASHAKDPVEAMRCKEAYVANRSEAEQEGFRANPAKPSTVVATAAPARKPDKAAEIASLTRALTAPDREESAPAAAPAPEPAPAPAPPPSSFSAANVMLGFGILLLLAGVVMHYLRRMTAVDAPATVTVRKSGSPRTIVGTPRNQY